MSNEHHPPQEIEGEIEEFKFRGIHVKIITPINYADSQLWLNGKYVNVSYNQETRLWYSTHHTVYSEAKTLRRFAFSFIFANPNLKGAHGSNHL